MKSFLLLVTILTLVACSTPEPNPPEAINDWLHNQRAFPSGLVNNALYHQEKLEFLVQKNSVLRNASAWRAEGPENIGGRITDVEMPHNSFDEIWVGSASGGVFKSTDRGLSWEEKTTDWGSPPIGDIAIRQTNPNEVWVGTGESNGGSGSIAYEGFGLLRTRNGGDSWENMGLPNSGSISKIALHPSNPFIIYVAAMGFLFEENSERGIFRSLDGGSTWENILYLGPTSGGSDIIIDPNNPDILYASIWERIKEPGHKVYWGPSSGIYKSIDGGDNWSKLDLGYTNDSLGRIGLAMAPSNSLRLYALVTGIDGVFEGFSTSSDGGLNWQTSPSDLDFNYRTSGYWYCNLTVDPNDMNHVFLCGLDVLETTDAGGSFDFVCDIHVDQHSIFLHPMNPQFGLIGNDGGLHLSNNQFDNCIQYQNIPITQFYTCALDPIDSTVIYGGTQDNNPLIRRKGHSNWETMLGGDGFVTLPDPRDNNILYSEYQYGNLFKSYNAGNDWERITRGMDRSRSNWNSPFLFEPDNPDVLYFGSHKVHKTFNGGDNWIEISPDLSNGPGGNLTYGTITSIDVSPLDTDIITAGTDDGNVWVTENGGSNWIKVSSNLPERWVTRVVCDPHDSETIYVTFSGLKWHDYLPHVFRSTDLGANWEDIGLDLPEVPVNDLIVDPLDRQRYWIATDLGVMESMDSGLSWHPLGEGMPVAIINDLDFNNDSRRLLAATFGRSMYSIQLPQIITSSDQNDFQENASAFLENGSITFSGLHGDFDVEVYTRSGQFLYSDVLKELDGQKYSLNYNLPNSTSMLIVVVRDKKSKETQAFKIVI